MRNIGRAAFLQKNYAESARALKVYVAQNPQDQRAQGMLALALYSIKNYPEAVAVFDQLGDAPMANPFMAYAWATSLARTNSKQRAADVLEKLTANPIPPSILVADQASFMPKSATVLRRKSATRRPRKKTRRSASRTELTAAGCESHQLY